MAEAKAPQNTVLKILSGVQSGVEVSLAEGEYGLGSGPDDDIQIVDVSLKPGHARLRVAGGKIEIAGAAGQLRTANGVVADAGGAWHEIEPLDLVSAGTTRFAMGLATANWASIADGEAVSPEARKTRAPAAGGWGPSRRLVLPAIGLAAVIACALWAVPTGFANRPTAVAADTRTELQTTQDTVQGFPFAGDVAVRQEVDGTIYVSGYVESLVERRALVDALRDTGVPARMRLWVRETMRGELQTLIDAEHAAATFQLLPTGEVTLDGLILDPAAAGRLAGLIGDRVLGVTKVTSHVRTAETLLTAVAQLAEKSQMQPYVLFRLDGTLIEANGAVPVEKIDAWVGFLQAYAAQYADTIPLRSLVQLQGVNTGGTPAQGIVLGGPGTGGDVSLDIARLQQGTYDVDDVLVGAGQGEAPVETASTGATVPQVADTGTSNPETPGPAGGPSLDDMARQLLEQWRDGELAGSQHDDALRQAVDALDDADGSGTTPAAVTDRYLPLFGSERQSAGAGECWAGSQVTGANVAGALFWLDLLSVSDAVTLTTFDAATQTLLLEAALNPEDTARCGERVQAPRSVYVSEVRRNPQFIHFITRDLKPFTLDIVGANLAQDRYVQTRAGQKMREGSAPDTASRIALVGELGVAVQVKDGLSAVIFGPDMNWIVR